MKVSDPNPNANLTSLVTARNRVGDSVSYKSDMLSFGANKTRICVAKLIKFNFYIYPDFNFRWLGPKHHFPPFRGCRDELIEDNRSWGNWIERL